ncbi:Hsp20/alpha crystallin family protein [Gulosibacter molinativorax]|uniref:Hsp20/alpha crystallin family protein n=1 Tax=Gulosibacter molinativorax TaxID=256821 RepID=A0ABT7C8D4_9MICO|nr:Hsp20/alpha crystallin family protein [Gulosibacter molinativorax]MDJ1371463.1 Hsp20/alpha crystallin family protein [Gulosibacter molinativorax]QUY62961.1 18 kDa heat shock protein [Gulosibacter molinativorax]
MATSMDLFRDFDRFVNHLARPSTGLSMPMDLHRDGDKFVAKIDLPGVDPESIDIDVEDRSLTVRAERKAEKSAESGEGEQSQWVMRERSYGTYARQLSLGRGLDLSKIEADYADGVLTLTIPVAEESKPRKVQVRHSNGSAQVARRLLIYLGGLRRASVVPGAGV